MVEKIIIAGAAGRDFHNYNVYFEGNLDYEVVAFTHASQIEGIGTRTYKGIPIYPESELKTLIQEHNINQVILAYSDLSHETVMQKASLVLASGADFRLMGTESTMLRSKKPVISVCAVRTGCGKSQTTKFLAEYLKEKGFKVVIVRHPMPYGDLEKQMCQRFATYEDLDKHNCTIEEREEYEQYVKDGFIIYAGVDYKKILSEAEKEADIILWDGGNNDLPFFKPDFHIVVVDPLRPGNELTYYPGQANLRMADMVIINKCNSARTAQIETVERNIKEIYNGCSIIKADSEIIADNYELITDKKVLVVEDGPTLTHGNMRYGAGHITALKDHAKLIVSPVNYAVGTIKKVFNKYAHLWEVLPAMGYNEQQVKDLEETINKVPCETVISATPIDLSKIIKINKPIVRVTYKLVPEERFNTIIDNVMETIY